MTNSKGILRADTEYVIFVEVKVKVTVEQAMKAQRGVGV